MSTKSRKEIYQNIEEYTTHLRLSAIGQNFSEVIQEARVKDSSYEEFLYTLLQKEWDKRQHSAMESRIRIADFPCKKYLEDISLDDLPEDARKKFKTLSSLDFINRGLASKTRISYAKTFIIIHKHILYDYESLSVTFLGFPLNYLLLTKFISYIKCF